MDIQTRRELRRRIADGLETAHRRKTKKRVGDGLWNDVKNNVKNMGRSVKTYDYDNRDDAVEKVVSYVERHPDAKFKVYGQAATGQGVEPVTLAVAKGKYLMLTTEDRHKLSAGSTDDLFLALEEYGFAGLKKGKKTTKPGGGEDKPRETGETPTEPDDENAQGKPDGQDGGDGQTEEEEEQENKE